MNPTPPLLIHRRLLKVSTTENVTQISNFLSPTTPAADGRDLSFLPVSNGSSTSGRRPPFNPNTHFDSSMALTILVLLTALFFMGFFSVYIRRFASGGGTSPTSSRAPAAPRRPEALGNRRGGLDPSAVRSLPLVAYGKHRGAAGGDCPICLSEFEEGETVKLIPYCGHVFHGACIDTWLTSRVTCPLCRSAQLFKRADGEEGFLGCDAAQV